MVDQKRPPLVPGRECNDCNVCCVDLAINEPGLRKLPGIRCQNALPDNRCAIYQTRPDTCRGFFCGWRMLKWVKPGLRPDTSGVLITLSFHDKAGGFLPPDRIAEKASTGVMVTLLRPDAIDSEGLLETLAAAVGSGVPVHISVPGPPGYTSGIVRIDEGLKPAVQSRNRDDLLTLLRMAVDEAKTATHEKIELPDLPTAATGRGRNE
jgi:hypothetical protein